MRIKMKWTLMAAMLLTAACGSEIAITKVTPAKGNRLGGENVTIQGAGFNDGAVVSFAGIEAVTTFVGETELQAHH